jgi:hypothetical protein
MSQRFGPNLSIRAMPEDQRHAKATGANEFEGVQEYETEPARARDDKHPYTQRL